MSQVAIFTSKSFIGSSCASKWWIVAGDTRRLCDHSVFSAFGLPWQADWLGAQGFPAPVLQRTGFPFTSSSLPVSYSERSTSPHSSFAATSFPVAVSHQKPAKVCIFSRAWELDAASGSEFPLILLLGFPRGYEYPRTFWMQSEFSRMRHLSEHEKTSSSL